MANSYEQLEYIKKQFQEPESYNLNGITYAKITDNNFSNYSQGQLRYNISSLYSSSASDKPLYELSEAYIQLYTTNVIDATNCTFPASNPTDLSNLFGPSLQPVGKLDNKNALSLKDPILLVNQLWCSCGGASVITSPTHSYLYNILKLRSENEADFKHKASILDRYLDSGNSMIIDKDVGEINNISSEYVAKNFYQLDSNNPKCKLVNRKFVPWGDGTNKQLIEVTHLTEAKLGELEIPYFKWVSATQLIWYDIVKVYLKDLDDFFKNMPSTQQISKFNLTVNTNISDSTSWTVTYNRTHNVDNTGAIDNSKGYLTAALHSPLNSVGALTTAGELSVAESYKLMQANIKHYWKPASVSFSAGNATCCPFLLGDMGLSRNNMLDTAGILLPADYNTTGPVYPTPTLTITSKIGWVRAGAGNTAPVSEKNQTFLFIPQVKWSPSIMPSIITNDPYEFYCKTATIDMNTFTKLKPNATNIKRPLNNQWSRVRNIYLIPFLTSDGFTAAVKPYESPLSSAPITNSFIYMNRIQIYQGGKPLLPSDGNNVSNIDYFDNQLYRVNNPMGNNILGPQSGMISKYDFRGGYRYYHFDMTQYCSDATSDATSKSYEISFDLQSQVLATNANLPEGSKTTTVDVVVIIEYENSFKMNRFTGEFVQ